MGDNLTILGRNYTNVAGIKATQTNDGQFAYIRPSGTYNITQNGDYDVTSSASVSVDVQFTPNLEDRTVNYTPSASAQSDVVTQTDPGYDGLGEVTVNIAAMPAGTEGTPTVQISKSSGVATITPSVTNSAGYIAATDPIVGTPVQVTGAELASGTLTISQSGETNVAGYEKVSVPLRTPGNSSDSEYYTSSGARKWRYRPKTTIPLAGWVNNGTVNGYWVQFDAIPTGATVIPTTSSQTIGAADTMLEGAITVEAMPNGSASTPATSITANPTISFDGSSGEIRALVSASQSVTPTVSAGYVQSGTAGTISVSGAASEYIITRDSSDLTASDATVTVPAGYYDESASKTIGSGTATAPASVSTTGASVVIAQIQGSPRVGFNKQTYITPSVTKGYIENGTAGMSNVTLYSDLIPKSAETYTPGTTDQVISSGVYLGGNQTISGDANLVAGNIKNNISIFGITGTYAGEAPNLQTKSVTPSESAQAITADSGYDGLDEVDIAAISSTYVGSGIAQRSSSDLSASGATVTVPAGYYANTATKSVSSGSATPASAISGTSATVSHSGTTLTLSKSISNTPQVSAGYVSSGTAGNSSVSLSATDANFTAANIKKNISIFGVTGTYEEGSKNAQTAQSTSRSTSTSGTSVISLTCSKTGTYDVYWTTFRSSTSGTWGSRLYIGGTAYETMNTSGWNNHVQNRHVSNVTIAANQAVAVYVQSRGSNYYGYVGTLTIIES